jgi:colanic acid biosynthesis glycosyl transferase WcaI
LIILDRFYSEPKNIVRILIYGLNYTPELTGIGKYTGELAAWLSEQKHEIRVVSAPPYYPAWQISQGYGNWWQRDQESDLRSVYRCPLWVPKTPSGLKRILHLLSFAISSFPVVVGQGLVWKPDLVLVVAPAIACCLGAKFAANLGGAKSWLHIQDLEVDAAFEMGILSNNLLKSLILKCEKWLIQQFDRVSTIAAPMQKRLIDKGIDQDRLQLFPNWVDTESIFPLDQPSPLRAEIGISVPQTVVLYSGNMGKKQGLEIVIAAAKIVTNPQIIFILCGDGSSRQELEIMAQGMANVRFLPLQSLENLNNLLNLADIHLLPQRSDVAELVMPSKLGGILACGGAVIATAYPHTEVANVVNDAGGIVCLPENTEQLADKISFLAQNFGDRQTMKIQARNYAIENLSKSQILNNFQSSLSCLDKKDIQSKPS